MEKQPRNAGKAAIQKGGDAAPVAEQVLEKAAAEVQVRAQARMVLVQKAGQANRLPVINQFTQQARPLLRAELIFARNVCDLNREELRKVNVEAQKMLDEVVAKMVDAQFQPRARVNGQGRTTNNLDAQQLLEEGVVSIMKKNLSAHNGLSMKSSGKSATRTASERRFDILWMRSTASFI